MLKKIPLADTTLNVFDAGSGPVLLFIHGFPLNHMMWSAQLQTFCSGNRVIAPDLRGFGQSAGEQTEGSMAQFADDIAGILDIMEIAEPVTLCGLSMGGCVLWPFWKRHPQRLARLIACNTRVAADSPEVQKNRLETAQRALQEGTDFLAFSMPERLLAASTRQRHPEIVTTIQQMIRGTNAQGISLGQHALASRPDVTDWLPDVNLPTLVISGTDDVISPPEEMRSFSQLLPQSTFVEVADAGHMTPMEQPDHVNRAIAEFLRVHPADA